ncbi:hypothetical protein [Candidatus Protochlamydia phocaeensis]|uniref:hypothetical protein n=1 Tax=Candidatus Protochlamydia phocaeensis TaxID=1414722 RepID=UPI000839B02A|nr:hypothetical protein [Candidatus Protochlamydia phocaeensis]
MPSISHYCPFTYSVFQKINHEKQKSYFVIKSNDAFLSRQIKQIGIYAKKSVLIIAMAVAALALPLFLIADAGLYVIRKCGVKVTSYFEDFHYFFESSVFESHYNQLKTFVKDYLQKPNQHLYNEREIRIGQPTSFKEKTQDLIAFILNPPSLNSENNKRYFHQQMLKKVRLLVEEKKEAHANEQEAVNFIEALCEWMYTGPKLAEEMVQFLEDHLPSSSMEILKNADVKDLPSVVKQFYDRLGSESKFNGIVEGVRLYDASYLGDVPSIAYKYPIKVNGNAKNIKIIRTPAVTRDTERNEKGELTQVKIVEEFMGFLDSYKKQNKVHVYINLMHRVGSEGIRSKAIEEVEVLYPDTLHVITLTKDHSFYWQKDAYQTLNEAAAFKAEFLRQMFDSDPHHYHWSPALGSDWKEKCRAIIEQVHVKSFGEEAELSQQQRMDFIEVAYTEIIEAIFEKLQPESANESCKSCIDRGASALGEQYAKRCHSQRQEWTERRRKRLAAVTLAPALLAMNRVLQPPRMPRMQSATAHILSIPVAA